MGNRKESLVTLDIKMEDLDKEEELRKQGVHTVEMETKAMRDAISRFLGLPDEAEEEESDVHVLEEEIESLER